MAEPTPPETADVLLDIAQRLGATLDLQETLERIAGAVVDLLGWGLAGIYVRNANGDYEWGAIVGPEEIVARASGFVLTREHLAQVMAMGRPRGRLRFIDGNKDGATDDLYFAVVQGPARGAPDAWDPRDLLFANLVGSDGTVLGVLSVDQPSDGLRPDDKDLALLEVLVTQATLALDHARVYLDLQRVRTEREQAEAQLRHQAMHDALTGLPNRDLVLDRVEQALRRSSGSLGPAVLHVDVDHFNAVNDTFGHATGDALLRALAVMLREVTRVTDTVARLGGDEFALILEAGGREAAVATAEKVLAACRQPLELSGTTVPCSVSIGIAPAAPGMTASNLLVAASSAARRAKAQGRGHWQVYDSLTCDPPGGHLTLLSELTTAALSGQFRLYYQPIVALPTGRPVGYEALLRWHHPERGMLAPGEFLTVLQDSDIDDQVLEWALTTACEQAATWDSGGYVAVNISPRQLARPDLAAQVADVLELTGLPADRLCIEITEDRPIDPYLDIEHLGRLRNLGVHIALDDLGTGYSSLTYLRSLPADTVKIDMSFVQQIEHDPVCRGIVSAVGAMADALGLRLVAEGVETATQRQALDEMGVAFGQGYLWGLPAPRTGDTHAAVSGVSAT